MNAMLSMLCLMRFVAILVVAQINEALDPKEIVVVVLSQSNIFHEKEAKLLKEDVEMQYVKNRKLLKPHVFLLHELQIQGGWTILPIMSSLVDSCPSCSAIVFCNENIEINLEMLTTEFLKLDFSQDLFGGASLQDRSPTIIHHYNLKSGLSFKYPDVSSGFFLSMPLLQKLSKRFVRSGAKIDFSIDAYYEFSQFVFDDGNGTNLTSFDFICGFKQRSPKCALSCGKLFPLCKEFETKNGDVIVAVKTCKKFHETRVSVLKETWARDVENIIYFSDVEDKDVPTTYVGVANTEHGHCTKFFLILENAHEMFASGSFKWLFIADDDSLLSMERLQSLLSCYDPDTPVFVGERYGYGVVSGHGYDYITLGGGMALSRRGLEVVLESRTCGCTKDDAPDDMTMGMCLQRLGLEITHSPHFHQARPTDYAKEHLDNQLPVSFHRHWEIDPYEVYEKWLKTNKTDNVRNTAKSEL